LLVDLANPKSADHVHHVFPEINHWVKQKTAEAVEVKPVIMNITSSAEVISARNARVKLSFILRACVFQVKSHCLPVLLK
jgi:hypothetical protein